MKSKTRKRFLKKNLIPITHDNLKIVDKTTLKRHLTLALLVTYKTAKLSERQKFTSGEDENEK